MSEPNQKLIILFVMETDITLLKKILGLMSELNKMMIFI